MRFEKDIEDALSRIKRAAEARYRRSVAEAS
jgi:hypothetical protein